MARLTLRLEQWRLTGIVMCLSLYCETCSSLHCFVSSILERLLSRNIAWLQSSLNSSPAHTISLTWQAEVHRIKVLVVRHNYCNWRSSILPRFRSEGDFGESILGTWGIMIRIEGCSNGPSVTQKGDDERDRGVLHSFFHSCLCLF
jgi:hypothetical protein